MHQSLRTVVLSGVLALASTAQTIILPQQAAAAEGNSSTPIPWSAGAFPSGSARVQNIYAASNFTNQGVAVPIYINQISWRANGFSLGSSSTFPNVTVKLSTAAPSSVLGPNPTFASNHGVDVATAYPTGPVSMTPVAGTSPNTYMCTVSLVTPFLYVPAWGDLCIDVSNQGATGIAGQQADLLTAVGASGSRLWDTAPNATVQTGATGQSQPGVSTVVRLAYSLAAGTLASKTSVGVGCGAQFNSFYENFQAAANFDLNGTVMTLTPVGNGAYVVSNTGSFIPVGAIGTPQTLALTDDSAITVPLTAMGTFPAPTGPTANLTICSNGWVSPTTGNSTVAQGTNALVLNAAQTIWCCWHDFDPTVGPVGSGVKFEESAGMTMITWDNVRNYGGTSVADDSTWQLQFFQNGTVVFAWQTMAATGGGYYTGYSPAGPSSVPSPADLSTLLAAGGFATQPVDVSALVLTSSSRPLINTNWDFTLSNIPPTGVIGVDILGLSNPNIPDLTGLGLPGCGLYSSLDLLTAYAVPGLVRSWSLALPNNPVFVGAHLYMSSAIFQVPALNPFGATTSNGIDGSCGDL